MIRSRPVLIVEDDDEQRELLRVVLDGEGHAVVEVRDGRAALDQLMAQTDGPCLIVLALDLRGPPMTGWELLAIIKSYTRLAKIPLIAVSVNEPSPEAERRGVFSLHLRRPFDAEDLLAAARTCLSGTAAEPRLE